jgi:hypothetical protein
MMNRICCSTLAVDLHGLLLTQAIMQGGFEHAVGSNVLQSLPVVPGLQVQAQLVGVPVQVPPFQQGILKH